MRPVFAVLLLLVGPALLASNDATGPVQGLALSFRGDFYCSYDYVSFRPDGTVVRERERCTDIKPHGEPVTYCEIREGRTNDFASLSDWVRAEIRVQVPQPKPEDHSTGWSFSTTSQAFFLIIERNNTASAHQLGPDSRGRAIEKVIHGVLAKVEWHPVRRAAVCPSAHRD
jgi:hypothetical protein